VNILLQRFVKDDRFGDATHTHIDTSKLDVFWRMCVSYAPPVNDVDPVVTFGWDRGKDAERLSQLQQQCTLAALSCEVASYRIGTPAMAPFLAEPIQWYDRLADFICSQEYVGSLKLHILGGDTPLPIVYSLYIKLLMLKDAAGAGGAAYDPLAIVKKLCEAIHAQFGDQCDDTTKAQLQQVSNQFPLLSASGVLNDNTSAISNH